MKLRLKIKNVSVYFAYCYEGWGKSLSEAFLVAIIKIVLGFRSLIGVFDIDLNEFFGVKQDLFF